MRHPAVWGTLRTHVTDVMAKKLIFAKWILHGLAVGGIILALAENLGVFRDKDRIEFLRLLEQNEECPSSHSGAYQFVDEFVYRNSQYDKTDRSEIDAIVFGARIEMISPGMKTGNVIPTGLVKIRNPEGKSSHAICSIGDIRDWAHRSRLSKWLPWWIIAVSVSLELLVFIVFEAFPKHRNP